MELLSIEEDETVLKDTGHTKGPKEVMTAESFWPHQLVHCGGKHGGLSGAEPDGGLPYATSPDTIEGHKELAGHAKVIGSHDVTTPSCVSGRCMLAILAVSGYSN